MRETGITFQGDRNQKKAYAVFLIYSGLIFFLFFLVFSVNSYFRVAAAGLDALQLVLVGTVLEISIFIFEIPTGVAADSYSRKFSVITGVLLMGLGFLLEGSIPEFLWILTAQVLWGVGYTFTSGALQAWITDELSEEKSVKVFLRGAQLEQAGAFAGIAVGAILANYWIRLPYLVSGGLLVLLAAALSGFMPERGFKPAGEPQKKTWKKMGDTLLKGMAMIGARPVLAPILWSGLFIGLYSEGFDRLWVAFVTGQFIFPYFSTITWLGIIQGSAMLFSAAAIGWVEKRVEVTHQKTLLHTQALIAVLIVAGLVVFSFSNQVFIAAAVYVLIMVLRGVRTPLYTCWVNHQLDPQSRATILSMTSLVDSTGQALGGPLTGVVARQTSIRLGILTSAGLLAPVLVVFGRMMRKEKMIL